MTDPKQSFTEEVQKERDLELGDHAFAFDRGATTALSILSRGGEGREFWINVDQPGVVADFIYTSKIEIPGFVRVIEYSAIVAERAKRESLENVNTYLASANSELDAEITTLRSQVEYQKTIIGASFKREHDLKENLEKCSEAIANWKKQVDEHGGSYLPGNYKQLSEALELQKKGQGE